ncbi:hypothetical protein [Bdellovibrio sp.]|uniref:hypothetical protein n=1 Tax=Bdellovibrio sp. TaxID=28201 RepID=UPI0039E30B79
MKDNVDLKNADELKSKRGRPRTVSGIPDVLKIKLIPISEPSDQLEKRANEVQDIITQIILLGMKTTDKK